MTASDVSRRWMLAATAGGAIGAGPAGRVLSAAFGPPVPRFARADTGSPRSAQPEPRPQNKPDKAPSEGRFARGSHGPPVSETAAAQEGVPTVPEPSKPKVGFALVGLGKLMVGEIIPALRLSKECEVRALVTGDRAKGEAVAASIGLDRARVFDYESWKEIGDLRDISAAYIATPNALHKRDTIAAAQAGKHVLCEKPMASTVDDCRQMIDACRAAGRKLMIAYRVHHEPINRTMKTWLAERRYGKPVFVTFDADLDVGSKPQFRLDARRAGGGSLYDIGIYALNTTIWLLGEEPVEVKATQHNDPEDPRFDEVEQSIAFHLRFPSGCIASCTSSYSTPRVNRYRVICKKGWLGMDPATHYRAIKGEHGTDDEVREIKGIETVNQFAAEFDHFATCIRDGAEIESPGEEGLRDVRLMQAIYEAARTGRAVSV